MVANNEKNKIEGWSMIGIFEIKKYSTCILCGKIFG
jgi:hypothetical protein